MSRRASTPARPSRRVGRRVIRVVRASDLPSVETEAAPSEWIAEWRGDALYRCMAFRDDPTRPGTMHFQILHPKDKRPLLNGMVDRTLYTEMFCRGVRDALAALYGELEPGRAPLELV